MNGDFCLYFVFEIEVANAWGHWFAGEFIRLNIQPTIFNNQFKNFLFLIKMFCQGSEAVFGLAFPHFVFVFLRLFIAVPNFTQNFISFDKSCLYCSYCLSCISSPPVLKPF